MAKVITGQGEWQDSYGLSTAEKEIRQDGLGRPFALVAFKAPKATIIDAEVWTESAFGITGITDQH